MSGNPGNIVKTSEEDTQYNCIAWAAEDKNKWWWPRTNPKMKSYWPDGIPNEETLNVFIQAFEQLGYSKCSNPLLEDGHDKIAIYCDNDEIPTHAARQLPSGQWTSKLGSNIDVSHDFEGLLTIPRIASEYGHITVIMKRPSQPSCEN